MGSRVAFKAVLLILAALLVLLAGCSNTQQEQSRDKARHEECTLTVQEAPTVEGFKLGSGFDDLRKAFPELPFIEQLDFERKTILPNVRFQTKDLEAEDLLPLNDIELYGSSALYNELGGRHELLSKQHLNLLNKDAHAEGEKQESGRYLVDKERHPEFKLIAFVILQYHRGRLHSFQVFYEPKQQWRSREAFAQDLTSKNNFPYVLQVNEDLDPDRDLAIVCKQSNKSTFSFTVRFGDRKFHQELPSVRLLDTYNFDVALNERRPLELYLANLLEAKSDAIDKEVEARLAQQAPGSPAEEKVKRTDLDAAEKATVSRNSVVIAGVTVRVGQDAYVSQDRLEHYRLKTTGSTDTYSHGGITYEITYAPGERGAYFVKSIRIIP